MSGEASTAWHPVSRAELGGWGWVGGGFCGLSVDSFPPTPPVNPELLILLIGFVDRTSQMWKCHRYSATLLELEPSYLCHGVIGCGVAETLPGCRIGPCDRRRETPAVQRLAELPLRKWGILSRAFDRPFSEASFLMELMDRFPKHSQGENNPHCFFARLPVACLGLHLAKWLKGILFSSFLLH